MPFPNEIILSVFKDIGRSTRGGFLVYDDVSKTIVFDNGKTAGIIDRPDKIEDLSLIFATIVNEDKEYVMDAFTFALRQSATTELEFRLSRRDGQLRYIHCSIVPIHSLNNVLVYIRDVSEVKQHEDYLVEFGAKKNTLLDTLAHQINGALHLSRNFSTELQRIISPEDVRSQKYFQLIDKNTNHCLQIIGDLMKEEHMKSPRVFVKRVRLNLVQKVNFVIEELRRSYISREFVVEVSNRELSVSTDDVKLLQVLNNLISNAIKFSNESEKVIVRLEDHGHLATIAVIDYGIGIPENLKPHVFERKGIAGRPGLNGEHSQGLGLSICKRLVELLNGSIWFESTEGLGSSFFVQVPKDT
jgi:two-component system sensor histidine kinase VicK